MLRTINGFGQTNEAAKVMAAIEIRQSGAALFPAVMPVVKPQAPKL